MPRLIHRFLCCILLLTSGASAQAEELVFSLWVAPTHPTTLAAKAWGERLQEETAGRLTVRIVPAQQLARPDQHLALVAGGEADLGLIGIGQETERLPVASVSLQPLLFRQASGASRAFDQWYRRYAALELKGVRLCTAFLHDPGALHSKAKIIQPDQLAGLKLRAPNPVMASYFALLGAKATIIQPSDTYQAFLSEGFDAVAFPWGSLFHYGLDRQFRHHLDLPLYAAAFLWVMNEARYDRLAADLRSALDRNCTTETGGRIADGWVRIESTGRERVKVTADQTVHRPEPQDLAAWRRPAELLLRDWRLRMVARQLDGAAMLEELTLALIREDAAF